MQDTQAEMTSPSTVAKGTGLGEKITVQEDALDILAKILNETAETPDEKLLSEAAEKRFNDFRRHWKEFVAKERKTMPREKGGENARMEDIIGRARWNAGSNPTPTFIDCRNPLTASLVDFPTVDLVDTLNTPNNKKITPSNDFRERLLRKLGVLKENEKIDELKKLPPYKRGYPRTGYYELNYPNTPYAAELPTNVSGVDLRVDFGASPLIMAGLNIETFQKVITKP